MPCLPLTSASYTKRSLPTTTAPPTQTGLPSFTMNEPPLPAIPAYLYEDNIERIEGSSKQKARKSKKELTKRCVGCVGGQRRTYVPSKLSECETADFGFEPEIDSAIVDLDENERVIVHEGITGVVALEEEYRSWCVDTQAIARNQDRDRERTTQYGVARVYAEFGSSKDLECI
ncbi:uncharacterized protein STEHIDRAFT_156112 [Stereum hirsutum FP-91666 SS1]|uniref:uncharacterized protein n=1 Tax=Stereum hirsutum (strain FP-91666) TaxID=721885 RepID=UPI000440F902|nr:uncharacterized protein STEHIDRAFT_156112 [Stereum hirsutum FP-91666 SS1]EIM87121.1 hypothetical protein STEHIDRAFT_156112 [Stereum hirsutum FP-91666 SS1]